MPSNPRSEGLLTATSRTNPGCRTPEITRRTRPSPFCSTKISWAPIKAVVVELLNPDVISVIDKMRFRADGAAKITPAANSHTVRKNGADFIPESYWLGL